MDGSRFDTWTRRRFGLAGGGLAAVLALTADLPSPTGAKKKGKDKDKQKLKLNGFGCIDVGKPCRGRNANCCSGICQGKKPKKGRRDRSTCAAHHAGGCQADEDVCLGPPAPQCGTSGLCFRTTGKANFCGNDEGVTFNPCSGCAKDADCVADFGPGAACVVCAGECTGPDTVCIPAAV